MSPANASSSPRSAALSGATEGRIDVRVARAEPVPKRGTQQLARSRGRRPLHDEVLAVEEIGGILRIRRHRVEAGKRRERRTGPFPSVAHEILDAPGARSGWMRAGGPRIPRGKIEHAVLRSWLGVAPRMQAFTA